MALEEVLERGGEGFEVAELAADDDARLEVLARDLDELGHAVVVDACRGKLRAADLEPGDALHPLRGGGSLLRLAGRRLCLLLAAERELALVEGNPLALRRLLLLGLLLLGLLLLRLLLLGLGLRGLLASAE